MHRDTARRVLRELIVALRAPVPLMVSDKAFLVGLWTSATWATHIREEKETILLS
ncbi:MAG: hypothetical protein JWM56_300 [Candidatus Peribacteria bacterium]|nr:hypothetical protein [Candidatus Peribacteria bacterium]